MGREIKFRAYSKGRMYYGGFSVHASAGKLDCMPGIGPNPEDAVVMQYTGLKDKNGKEIYEGDLLADGLRHYLTDAQGTRLFECAPVVFDDEIGAFAWRFGEEWGRIEPSEVYVVGNIHENPELIEGQG